MEQLFCVQRALQVLGFDETEILGLFQVTSAVLLMGQMKFAQRSNSEQAFPDGTSGKTRKAPANRRHRSFRFGNNFRPFATFSRRPGRGQFAERQRA